MFKFEHEKDCPKCSSQRRKILKPINLKMSAFGPYKNEEEIDFQKIGDSRNFLNYRRYWKSGKR